MIIWLVPPASLTFVRVQWEPADYNLPIRGHNYTVVGYETAPIGTLRRVFTLRDYDCLPPGGFIPAEAVAVTSL